MNVQPASSALGGTLPDIAPVDFRLSGFVVIISDHQRSGVARPRTGFLRYSLSGPIAARCATQNSF
jgi:hypothetical protein